MKNIRQASPSRPTCHRRSFGSHQKTARFLTYVCHRLILCARRFANAPRFDCLRASAMKPAPFKYIAATSLEHALSLKAEHGDEAKFLAGGQSLMPTMNFRLARPAILIDINRIEALSGIRTRRGDDAGRPADPLSGAASATPAFVAVVSPDRRGAAAYRASTDPEPRHDRRQSFACRSCVGTPGHRGGAARAFSCPVCKAARGRSRLPTFSSAR